MIDEPLSGTRDNGVRQRLGRDLRTLASVYLLLIRPPFQIGKGQQLPPLPTVCLLVVDARTPSERRLEVISTGPQE